MPRIQVWNAHTVAGFAVRAAVIALALAACEKARPAFFAGRGESALRFERKDSSASDLSQNAAGPKVIRSGELRIQVKDVDAAALRADSSVVQRGGLVANREQSAGDNGRRSAHLVVRVPADRFADLMQNLKLLGSVKNETVSQQDVTKAYFDVETRLSVKEQSLGRLRQLLATKAARLADVLDVEREMTRVVAEIEELKGERRLYDNRIALSTIELTVFEEAALAPGPSFTVGQALRQSIEVLSTSLAWLVYLITFLLPWAVVTVLVWWIVRRLRKRAA
jgi:hypothetical protein